MSKHYSYFLQLDDAHADECRSLQIYSDLPVEELIQKGEGTISVARWHDEGCELHGPAVKIEKGIYRAPWETLWDGVGMDVPFESRYFPFASVGTRKNEFRAISEITVEKGVRADRIDRLQFLKGGEEIALIRHYTHQPQHPTIVRFRRLFEKSA